MSTDLSHIVAVAAVCSITFLVLIGRLIDAQARKIELLRKQVQTLGKRAADLFSESVDLQEQIAEADEYLPEPTGPYQTLGERAKLLKDQMGYAVESYGEAMKKLASTEPRP